MRCPKCSYLSYDDTERCRNCGYDFALATTPREPELPVPVDPTHEPRTWEPTRRRRPMSMDTPPPTEGGPLDLPLFEEPSAPEPPPIVIPPAGPPLSVRRKVEISRPPARMEPMLDSVDPPASPAFDWPERSPRRQCRPSIAFCHAVRGGRVRGSGRDQGRADRRNRSRQHRPRRVVAHAACRRRVACEWRLLPLVPLGGFLFLLDTAYLVTFTAASGQTIGKMLSGVRVVYGDHGRVPFGHAVLRSVALLLCVIPAGLGLLPVFMDPERRGAHDRLAGTRVVPAA